MNGGEKRTLVLIWYRIRELLMVCVLVEELIGMSDLAVYEVRYLVEFGSGVGGIIFSCHLLVFFLAN